MKELETLEEAVRWFCEELEQREDYLALKELGEVLERNGFVFDPFPPRTYWDPQSRVRVTEVLILIARGLIARGDDEAEVEVRYVRDLSETPPIRYWEILSVK
jgi:hypothetical protein